MTAERPPRLTVTIRTRLGQVLDMELEPDEAGEVHEASYPNGDGPVQPGPPRAGAHGHVRYRPNRFAIGSRQQVAGRSLLIARSVLSGLWSTTAGA